MDTVRSVSCFLLEHRVAHNMAWYDSQNGHFIHTSVGNEGDLNIALKTLLSGGWGQQRPVGRVHFGSAPEDSRYADVIYLCSRTGSEPDALISLRERLTESRICFLLITAEQTDSGNVDVSRAEALEIDVKVIDSENVEKSLNALVL